MAGRNRCGFVLTAGANKGKKCNLGAGHDTVSEKNPTATAHKYTAPKARPALDISAISANVVKVTDKQTVAKHRRTRDTGEKSAERKFADQVTQAAYDSWEESGKPTDSNVPYGLLLSVPKPQVEAFKERIHTSARALGYKANFGRDVPGENGTIVVFLRIVDMPPENANGESAPTPETADTSA